MSQYTFLPTLADGLLYQHELLATAKIDQAMPGDRGELLYNPIYDKVLEGLQLVARHAALPLLDHLLGWRKEALVKATRAGGDVLVLRKRLAVEQIFLETAAQLVSKGSSPLSDKQADALEKLAFDWILNAEKYVESRFPELARARDKVTGLGAVIIGSLGDTRLPVITERYLKEVEIRLAVDLNSARQEIVQLTEGMKQLRLPTETSAQLAAATDFLTRLHPLKHTAVQRKSFVHHAMCEMLAAILSRMVSENRPRGQAKQLSPAALGAWHQIVFRLRADLQSWTARHSKHAPVSYPLMTLLVCLMDEDTFRREVESQIEMLTRQLRDKTMRMLLLQCLVQCYSSLLTRLPPNATIASVSAYLAKHTKTITTMLRKNNLPLPEHHDAVREIWVAISENAPHFGLGTLVPEMLQDASNWDVLLIGLRALITVLLDAPARIQQKQQQSGRSLEAADGSPELLDLVRNEIPPLSAYGVAHLTPRLSASLAKILQQCHTTHGGLSALRYSRTPSEGLQPGRPQSMQVFTAALRCVPYIMPEHWTGGRLMDELPVYTLNPDMTIRAVAAEVLRRIMWGLPGRRNEVLIGMASFASRLSDDPESVSHVLSIVEGLMHEWIDILDEKQQGMMKEPQLPAARRLDLARIEGIAVGLLCTNDAEVRRQAVEILKTLRTLHRSLLASSGSRERPGPPAEEVNYLISILENSGGDVARQCYWDFGRWADLWRVWRVPGDDRLPGDRISFEDSMRRVITVEDQLRWARMLVELMKSACKLCPASAAAAFNELSLRFNAQMIREPATGRAAFFPPETETHKLDIARSTAMVALACPFTPPTAKPPPVLSTRDIIRLLTTCLRNGVEQQQQVAVFALGYCNSECYDALSEELQFLMEDYTNERIKTPSGRKARGADIRVQTAHIFRMVAGSMPPGTLLTHRPLCSRMLEFASESLRFVSSPQSEIWPDVMLVRYCLCFVVRALSSELAEAQPATFTPQSRRSLFDALAVGCNDGTQGRHKQEIGRAISAAKLRFRSDYEQSRQAEADVVETAEYLEHATHMALASLLIGASFDTEAKRHQGRAFAWIERMLTAGLGGGRWGPKKDAVARVALKNLLASNHDLLEATLDRCYSSHAAVSRAYFQVLVEVYARQNLDIKPHLLLSLVLYKMVDPQLEVRDDALHMLSVLSMRVWREGMVGPRVDANDSAAVGRQGHVAVVVGNLQDTYQEFQYQVSVKLAREHPELSEGLCVEMMTRQLDNAGGHTLQHQVLTALAPWMENLNFRARWEGNWSESLLKAMYFVTLQHGGAFPHEIERLWSTVAANKRNVIPILEFLISRGLQELNAQDMDPLLRYFDVGKRISLYLARMSPQQTIDHLAFEITQLIEADDEPLSTPTQTPLTAFEFHHGRPLPSRQSSHSSTGGGGWHERQRSQSKAAATGASGLAGLNLMPQSLLPEIMPDIPQMLGESRNGSRRVSQMLRSASSARADVAEGFAASAAAAEGSLRESADYSVASSRRVSIAAAAPVAARGSMMRAEVAVCLLAEVAYEHDEDFRGHLPLLLHSMLLLLDSTDALVFRHAQQVITHLLYSLSVRHLELHRASGAMLTEYQKVTSLLTYLQTMRGLRLWHYEDVGLGQLQLQSALALSALATAILESIFFERDLRERWAAEALRWMTDSNSRHLACRSHQIYRALRPAASLEACGALLSCLYKCMAGPSQLALEVAADVLLTLQAVVDSMDEGRLLLYPQLLLTCLAMLPTTYTHLYILVVDLLQKVLDKVDLNDATLQHVLLASTPLLPDSAMPQLYATTKLRVRVGGLDSGEGWPLGIQLFGREALLCVQQFLIKGLFRPETELCTIEVLACLAEQVSNLRQPHASGLITADTLVFDLQGAQTYQAGLGAILGEVESQLAISIMAQLPWLCRHFRYSVHAGLASVAILAHARASQAAGLRGLADALVRLRRTATESLSSILGAICSEYARAFFPRFVKVAIQRLMEVLQKGDEVYHAPVLDILIAMFKVEGLDLGCAAYYKSEADKGLLAPIASLLEGQHSHQALQVLEAVIEYQDRHPEGELADAEMLQWPKAVGSNPGGDTQSSLEALGRLHEAWGAPRKKALDALMPFIAGVQLQGGRPGSAG